MDADFKPPIFVSYDLLSKVLELLRIATFPLTEGVPLKPVADPRSVHDEIHELMHPLAMPAAKPGVAYAWDPAALTPWTAGEINWFEHVLNDEEPFCWLVVDESSNEVVHASRYRDFCNDHINDALAMEIEEAKAYVLRPAYLDPCALGECIGWADDSGNVISSADRSRDPNAYRRYTEPLFKLNRR